MDREVDVLLVGLVQTLTLLSVVRPSEDIAALVQARFTDFSTEYADYPDLSNMKIKGVRSSCATLPAIRV